jgi:adenylyltransferase/sulfurtransferase
LSLSNEQLNRYQNQLSVPGMTKHGQELLLAGKVLVLGGTGAGAVAVKNLSEVGLGTLTVWEPDSQVVEEIRKQHAEHASINPDIKFKCINEEFDWEKIESIISQFDLVIDALQNWQSKFILSDLCMEKNRPLVHSGVTGFRFQIYAMQPKKSACLRCALPVAGIDEVPLLPTSTGTISAVSELVGAWQAIETIKIVAKVGATQGNEFFKFDCLSGEFEIFRGLDPRHDCPDCGAASRRPKS